MGRMDIGGQLSVSDTVDIVINLLNSLLSVH